METIYIVEFTLVIFTICFIIYGLILGMNKKEIPDEDEECRCTRCKNYEKR